MQISNTFENRIKLRIYFFEIFLLWEKSYAFYLIYHYTVEEIFFSNNY